MFTELQGEIQEEEEQRTTPLPRVCPLMASELTGERDCVRENCAWFVRNGCAIFHLACSAIEWEKVLRRGGNV